jgi:UDP-glucose 4-epimerase
MVVELEAKMGVALVTGAGGFIGSHLVDRLKDVGYLVIGVDCKQRHHWIKGDQEPDIAFSARVEDPKITDFLNQKVDIDVCFHLAAESRIQPSFSDPCKYVSSNVLGTARILDICRYKGARVVYAGSSTADDNVAKNVYATCKFAGEELCKAWHTCFGLKVATTRFYNVYGRRQIEDGQYATVIGIFERQMRNGECLTVTGNGSHRRDFTAVEDIVDGLIAVAEEGNLDGRVYPLGTGTNYAILDVARMFVPDNQIRFIPRPPGESEVTKCDSSQTTLDTGWRATRRLDNYIASVKNQFDLNGSDTEEHESLNSLSDF